MTSVEFTGPVRRDWILANPWLWMGLGISSCSLSWLLTQFLGDSAEPARVFMVALGLLAVGSSLVLRLPSNRPAFASRLNLSVRTAMFTGLAILFGILALVFGSLFVLRLAGLQQVEVKLVGLFLILALAGPAWVYGALASFRRAQDSKGEITDADESAVLLVAAALALFISHWALYLPEDPLAWDTIRLLLDVGLMIALFAAPLMLLPQTLRRVAISGLLLFHFGGIATATLAAPPSPWIISQLWTRVYRPYLEFMYLNNAYHFYSPEPGPPSFLWFRVFWLDEQNDKEYATWYKIPKMDERGWPDYPVSLTYQRILAVTENTAFPGTVPPRTERDRDGNIRAAEYYELRVKHSTLFQVKDVEIIGKQPFKPDMIIPLHPAVPDAQQYIPPSQSARWLLESYVRHVSRMSHPEHPEWKVKSIKIYRVIHIIPPPPLPNSPPLHRKFLPLDPELYRPYYMGEYDPQGQLISKHGKDPFLYWLLPIMRDPPFTEEALIRDYARKHAGDPAWLCSGGKWVDERSVNLGLPLEKK